MFKRILTAALVFGTLGTAPPAFAMNCALRDQLVDRLQSKYNEQLTAGGLHTGTRAQALIEVWSSPDSGTFSVILTNPNGTSCIVASGTDWHNQPNVMPVEGTPS